MPTGILRGIWRAILPRSLRLRAFVFRGGDILLRLRLYRMARGKILTGPFAGVHYPPYAVGSEYFPKLLGTYEKELHPLIESWQGEDFNNIVIAGAGEGYYVGGMAARYPRARITSFEIDPEGREAISGMARANRFAERLENNGCCDVPALRRALDSDRPSLLIMDVEGAERELLDPSAVPVLRRTWILVEVHDCFIPGLDLLLRERFTGSHEVGEIPAVSRGEHDIKAWLPAGVAMTGLLRLVDEKRPAGMRWFVMRPK
jgi:hypothetical protein